MSDKEMTVGELIEILKEADPKTRVRTEDSSGWGIPEVSIVSSYNEVWVNIR